MKKPLLFTIILFLVVALIIAALMRNAGAGDVEISCALNRIKYDWGIIANPPECLVGTNMVFVNCEGDAYPESDNFNDSRERIIRRFHLPFIYERLVNNCLSDLNVGPPGDVREIDLKIRMLELLTVRNCTINCISDFFWCNDTNVRGHVDHNDADQERAGIYFCDENIRNYDGVSTLITHEMTHVALGQLAGNRVGLQEGYPDNVAANCGRR